MRLIQILKSVSYITVHGDETIEVTSIENDSRKVKEGSLFVAVKGTIVDGHDYIPKAIEKGCSVIVCEELPPMEDGITYVVVENSAKALGCILSSWYQHPSKKLKLVGVTGTNGKTTIATLLYNTFQKLGYKAGLISTVCNMVNEKVFPTNHTTPDPTVLHSLIAEMADAGCEYAFMEVSSHAIDQDRIAGLTFEGGIFTNLTRDHLDYHLTIENYLKAKKKFFDELPSHAFAITNRDDKVGEVMLQNTKAKKLTYALRMPADYKGKVIESHFEGTEITINGVDVVLPFVGRFNVYNLLAVYGAAICLGQEKIDVLTTISSLKPVAGRFQPIYSPLAYTAIVDYAHTPDALINVLESIHDVLNGNGKVITVVGCGGNRDKGKRPIMAKEAVKRSDQLIITSDNPRFEDPEEIIKDMVVGLNQDDLQQTICITDRQQAIKTATMLAQKGDVILVAGKGHEDYQDVKGEKHHFDDREILMNIFKQQK